MSWQFKSVMTRLTVRGAIAIMTFIVGVTVAALWAARHYGLRSDAPKVMDCVPQYVPHSAAKDDWELMLDKFEEMPLRKLPACVDESYRFIWLPAFHAPMSIRIWRSGPEQFIVAKQLDGRGGDLLGPLALQKSRSLNDDEWNECMRLLRQAGYWDLPKFDEGPIPNDGARWLIDGFRNKQIHQVIRHSPVGNLRDVGIYLASLSGLKTEIENY